jgi:hypothetical protein
MSPHAIHIRSEDPDLLIEFELPPGTHARIGASPKSEITLPLGGIPPFLCILGRFHDGRLYMADLDEAISRRVDLPDTLAIDRYHFTLFHPEDPEEVAAQPPAPLKSGFLSTLSSGIRSLFVSRKGSLPAQKPNEDGNVAAGD